MRPASVWVSDVVLIVTVRARPWQGREREGLEKLFDSSHIGSDQQVVEPKSNDVKRCVLICISLLLHFEHAT